MEEFYNSPTVQELDGQEESIETRYEQTRKDVRDKGVRYNPDLVEFIENSPALQKKLAAITGPERVDMVYEIYSRTF